MNVGWLLLTFTLHGVWVVRSKIMCNASTYGWCQCLLTLLMQMQKTTCQSEMYAIQKWLAVDDPKRISKRFCAYLYLLHKIQKMSGCGWKNIQSSFMKVQTADGHWLRSSLCSSGPHLLKNNLKKGLQYNFATCNKNRNGSKRGRLQSWLGQLWTLLIQWALRT